jgi:hypothetical protein
MRPVSSGTPTQDVLREDARSEEKLPEQVPPERE